MQKYKNNKTNPFLEEGISCYMLLKLNLNQFETMSKFDLNVNDARYIPVYEEYLRMRKEGLKITHIISSLAEKHFLSESTVKRIVKRLSRRVIL